MGRLRTKLDWGQYKEDLICGMRRCVMRWSTMWVCHETGHYDRVCYDRVCYDRVCYDMRGLVD